MRDDLLDRTHGNAQVLPEPEESGLDFQHPFAQGGRLVPVDVGDRADLLPVPPLTSSTSIPGWINLNCDSSIVPSWGRVLSRARQR